MARHCGAGRDAGAAADDGVGAEIAGVLIGDVHRAAFAAAIAGFLAQQLGEHPVDGRAFGEAVAMAAMGAGDVVVATQGLADADRDRFFADIEMRQTGHRAVCRAG